MTGYEFSLRQEVLMEVGASVLGDLFRYSEEKNIESKSDPVTILYRLIWNAKQDILLSKTEAELDQIEGKFHLARNFLSALENAQTGGTVALKKTVEREVELAKERYTSHRFPKAVLLAGQPGAGKTILSSLLQPGLNDDVAIINGDDYRRYHPYGHDSVSMTSAFSGEVTETLIDCLSDLSLNLIIEGTGRTIDVPKKTAELLTGKGYTVGMAVIATRPVLSLISSLLRLYRMKECGIIPRATPLGAHDNVVAALPSNLDALCSLPCISQITVWTREAVAVYNSKSDKGLPSKALKQLWNSDWSPAEKAAAEAQIKELRTLEKEMALGQSSMIDEIDRRYLSKICRV